MSTLIDHIRGNVIGERRSIRTPFGDKPLVYADYTASGRALGFIEHYIQRQVLPFYANTHTETSLTGAQTSALREQARQQIRRAVNGTAQDKVIFCGAGATAAINKLIDILNLRLPRDLDNRYQLASQLPAAERPVVFIGPYEHHSNELPWRESIADVVVIPLDDQGQLDVAVLQQRLIHYADRPQLIGSFSAASNVTGVKTDIAAVTALLKQHGAVAFWDFAAAAPYQRIDMNGATPLDAVFISPHKFIGGPGTPGVLVVKQALLCNSVPATVGGGTVLYVTPEGHRYIEDCERREEGGTPAIVEAIRAGLVFKLQQEVGVDEIERREQALVQRAISRLEQIPKLKILGSTSAPRLSIMSLRFTHGSRDLHYGFVVSLLNDLFGIQVRGGCSCAGPYGHSLLGMGMRYSRALETEIANGAGVLRPGWVRLNFNYFIAEDEFEYLLRALELVAQHGWRLLPWYHFDPRVGVWRYQGQPMELANSLDNFSFTELCEAAAPELPSVLPLAGICAAAEGVLLRPHSGAIAGTLQLSAAGESLRWFVLPQEVTAQLQLQSA